jgi:bifunctional non-homologous end joining protein LigD
VVSDETSGRGEEVELTNLDQPLFEGADATKRDLVDYVGAVGEQLLGELRDRPLSVMRALRGRRPFMQKTSRDTRRLGSVPWTSGPRARSAR